MNLSSGVCPDVMLGGQQNVNHSTIQLLTEQADLPQNLQTVYGWRWLTTMDHAFDRDLRNGSYFLIWAVGGQGPMEESNVEGPDLASLPYHSIRRGAVRLDAHTFAELDAVGDGLIGCSTGQTSKLFCQLELFEEHAYQCGARSALCEAKSAVLNGSLSDCHLAAHAIGRGTLRRAGGNIVQAINDCGLACVQGCIHGVVEAVDNLDLFQVFQACDALGNQSTLYMRQCLHGAGHMILAHGRMTYNEALNMCEEAGSKRHSLFHASTCQGGVRMEHVAAYLTLPEKDLIKILPNICDEVRLRLRDSENSRFTKCLRSLGEGLVWFAAGDKKKAKHLCQTGFAHSPSDGVFCVEGLNHIGVALEEDCAANETVCVSALEVEVNTAEPLPIWFVLAVVTIFPQIGSAG
eukprot:gnl/MRDRNA2_/MRDRNA2_31287_c0_seq1.p1 gnl/MRDRNA2_/MRDRNA2_31287_c0~~gnl/MRDRNA2_/MRDRNA2_31287_c0_seq1.p1  ORF type:complete len:450 (-),score=55.45 gnl/MRDRNA2_/MRDRNA2_31287_c0_seq1:201-1418(-)